VVKYAATLYMERNTKGHNKAYIAIVIFSALVMLGFQIYFIHGLNISNDSLLFCGDVIGKLNAASRDNKKMFTADSLRDFNRTWYAKAIVLENDFLKR
jgi:hypothetical protein